MIAADSSTLIAYIQGDAGPDANRLDAALGEDDLVLPPVVLSELLSDPALPARHRTLLLGLPVMRILPDYWIRAGATRAALLSRRLRARLAHTLIAQSCIDHDVPLITRDRDYRHFAAHCGLRLAD